MFLGGHGKVHAGPKDPHVGNAELVRGLSDALSIARLAGVDKPARSTFEDILGLGTRATDAYYWLGHADTGDLKTAITTARSA